MEQLKLICFYSAEKPHSMVIPIGKDALVTELLEKIHEKLKEWDPDFDVAECDLSLYKADLPSEPYGDLDDRAHRWILDHLNDQLHLLKEIGKLFRSPPSQGLVHILVSDRKLRHEHSVPAKRALSPSSEHEFNRKVTDIWRTKRAKIEIPRLENLLGFIKQPLAVEEKIQLNADVYRSLISHRPHDLCMEEDVQSLFQPCDGAGDAKDLNTHGLVTAVLRPPPRGGTENAFIGFWDANIRSVIETLIPYGTSIRNSNQHTETRNLRPDFGHLISDKCVFRGEEKGPNNKEDPKEELRNKLPKWVYSPAPYVLGYYCNASVMTLVAITPPPVGKSGIPVVHDLVTVDLSLTKGRIDNIRHLINLASLLKPLADMISSAGSEYEPMERRHCTVEITTTLVVKVYTSPDAESRVQRLQSTYNKLREKQVPNVDQLIFARGNTVHLGPRGIATEPGGEGELRKCLKCVLEALIVTHQIPLFHRDIRWSNIVRAVEDQSKWFIIDWEDAAYPPTLAQEDFTPESHSPAIKHDGHGAEVDIWGVGHLITSCLTGDISMDLKALGRKICEDSERLTARMVLDMIEETT